MAADPKYTHRALRPVKLHDKTYAAGELFALDEDTASNLGVTAVEPYVIPVEEMTAAQLSKAATEAKLREKAIADTAAALLQTGTAS